MKINYLLLFYFLVFSVLQAQVEFSGFFDIFYQENFSGGQEEHFGYGQFEIDPAIEVGDRISAEAALAYNPDEQKLELGAGFVDFHLFGEPEKHPARGKFLTHSGLMIGQFDVPFGLDYQFIPSPSRKLITPPLVNQKTIDSWNDVGLNLYGSGRIFKYSLFLLNGFYQDLAVGGRFVIQPFQSLNLGGSYFTDRKKLSEENGTVRGLEAVYNSESFELRGEYLSAENILDGSGYASGNLSGTGYYLQLLRHFQLYAIPMFVTARYGAWKGNVDENGDNRNDKLTRYTLGFGFAFSEGAELRTQYLNMQNRNEKNENKLMVQTVVKF